MLSLPTCRHRGDPPAPGRVACSSPLVVAPAGLPERYCAACPVADHLPVAPVAPAGPTPAPPACVHYLEAPKVRGHDAPDPFRDWRRCPRGYGVVSPCKGCGPGCPGYEPEPAAGSTLLAHFDAHNLCPGVPGLRFNPGLAAWGGGYALAYRTAYRDSDVWVTTLDNDFQPAGPGVRLGLTGPACAAGREDPALFVSQGVLHVSFTGLGAPGGTSVLYARLGDGFRVEEQFTPRYARRRPWEKNWGFFEHNGELLALYSSAPRHRVLRVEGDIATPAHESVWEPRWAGGEIRGGAPPVRVGNEYLCFFHDSIPGPGGLRVYRAGLYTFAARPPFRPLRLIPEPILAADLSTKPAGQHAYVIFPRGAVRDGDRWVASCGVHDRWAEIHSFRHADLESRLVAVD